MNDKQRNLGRVALYATVIGSMAIAVLPAGVHSAAAQGNSRKIGDFDVAGRFLEVWSAQGNDQSNTYVNGLPITSRRAEISTEDGKTYDTQWFERAKYEAHPENKAPYDVLLGRLGANFVEGRGSIDGQTGKVRNPADAAFVGIDKPADANGTSKAWFQETKHSVSGKIKEYWDKYGGLQQFGFPLSEAFNEVSTDGKTYSTQYFERAKFEVHPEKADPYAVELGLLGVQQYKATPIAADKLPIAPTQTTSAKDTYTAGSLQEPDTMFCNEANTVVAIRFCAAVTLNDGLVQGDDKENYFPLAAWYVPTIENGGSFYVGAGDDRHLVTKFKLRKGIKWADGSELTSADAVFAYKLILDDPLSVSTSLQKKISFVDNPDKYTVVYNWMSLNQAKAKLADPKTDKSDYAFLQVFVDQGKPVVDLNYAISTGVVLEKKNLEKIPVDKIQESSEGQKPSGYGPYMVQDWKQGDTMTLVANPNYNLTAAPPIKRVINKFNTDVNANVNAYLTGNLDAIESEGFVVPPEQSDQIKAAGGIVANVPAASWEHLDFRMDWGPFTELPVRQAIAYAINRQQIVNVVYKGGGAVMNGPVPPPVFHSLENPDFAKNFPAVAAKYKLPVYAFDQAKANSLLDGAGWVKGSDGIRAKGGQKLSFEYATTRNATRQAIQALVANDLKAVGVDAQVVNYPTGYFNEDGPIATGKCKLCQFAYVQTSTSNFDNFDSSQINTEANPGGQNRQHYSNSVVDQNARLFASELARDKQAEYSAALQVQVMTDVALVPVVQRANIEIYSGKLKNRKTTNTSFPQWWNIGQWYFAP
jgi:peptide/nickel transport system substrate-binding protein